MPGVWAQLKAWKAEWGVEHVAQCIRRGMAGEPDWFYAFEAGQVVGTPFQADTVLAEQIGQAAALGIRFAAVMRPPLKEAADGAH